MKHLLPIIALVFAGLIPSQGATTVSAHTTGESYGKVDTNIIITEKEQTVFHFHSDFTGGGTWYQAVISIVGGNVTIVERDSISTPYKSGNKVVTTEHIYRLPVDKIAGDEVELAHGNRIVLTKSEEDR